jgi:hypothetical protein
MMVFGEDKKMEKGGLKDAINRTVFGKAKKLKKPLKKKAAKPVA